MLALHAMARPATARLLALDWLRGLVIVLMTIDHASGSFNAGRVMTDAVSLWKPGSPLPADQFLLRWITHLCAPTFVFLAGASIALSAARRRARGDSERSIDRALVLRGLFIALLDPLWMSLGFTAWHAIVLGVLYAIGVSMMAMALLRRVPARWLAVSALAYFAVAELVIGLLQAGFGDLPWPASLVISGGVFTLPFARPSQFVVAYPVLPWLAVMALGHAVGEWLRTRAPAERVVRPVLLAGLFALGLFGLVRGANGYGNMALLRDDLAPLQWLHVSKYPPSLSYLLLELGLMALVLGGLLALERSGAPGWLRPLGLLGQTALFFYVLHVHLLGLAALLLDQLQKAGIAATLLASGLVLLALYPACVRYARYKVAHPDGLARYL